MSDAVFKLPLLPEPLLARGLALGLIDMPTARRLIERTSFDARTLDQHIRRITAILSRATLDPAERATLEEIGLADVRALAAKSSEWALEALAVLAPQLALERQTAARAWARPLLEKHRSLNYHQLWRVLAPDEYSAWVQASGLLERPHWYSLEAKDFLMRLSPLPGLDEDAQRRLLEIAMVSAGSTRNPHINADVEEGIGGIQKFNDAEIEQAQRRERGIAVRTVIELLPRKRDPARLLRRAWGSFRWAPYQRVEVEGVAWVAWTLSEDERLPLAAKLVDRYDELAREIAQEKRGARPALYWLIDVALPPLAPVFSAEQTARLLALYDLAPPAPVTPAERIQQLIGEPGPQGLGDWPIRESKERFHALPIMGNWIYLWSLQPDGTVLCIDHEAFSHHTEPETDPLIIYAVLARAAQQHPDLAPLVPSQPPNAAQCDSCAGTGMRTAEGRNEFCISCFGLGWHVRRG